MKMELMKLESETAGSGADRMRETYRRMHMASSADVRGSAYGEKVVRCDDAVLMTYRIVYEDGDEESDLPLAEVLRLLLPPKSKAKAKRKRVNT